MAEIEAREADPYDVLVSHIAWRGVCGTEAGKSSEVIDQALCVCMLGRSRARPLAAALRFPTM